MDFDVILIFDWRDGPIEGVLRRADDDSCWHFGLLAERLGTDVLDDRLFSLTAVPDSDAAVLVTEFGPADPGTHVWPAEGGLGSTAARQAVDRIFSTKAEPRLVVRTWDFTNIDDVWRIPRSRL